MSLDVERVSLYATVPYKGNLYISNGEPPCSRLSLCGYMASLHLYRVSLHSSKGSLHISGVSHHGFIMILHIYRLSFMSP
jgi:hypothetical protein